jgi:hypothetical protein
LVVELQPDSTRGRPAYPIPLSFTLDNEAWWFTFFGWLIVVPADFVMSRDMLHGVKERAERASGDNEVGVVSG